MRATKLMILSGWTIWATLVGVPASAPQETHAVRPRKPVIVEASADLKSEILTLQGTRFGSDPVVFMGTSGALQQLELLSANDSFIEARLGSVVPGTYLVIVRRGLQFGVMNVTFGATGLPGEPGPPGEPGVDGAPGNLVLANLQCSPGSFVTGFDGSGRLVCGGDIPSRPVCGNGVLELDEACDDGNAVAGDGCSPGCRLEDLDRDGVIDPVDNCPDTPNPGQLDTDGDGTGDDCEGTPVDVLFVVDSSAAMEAIEHHLATNLPEFQRTLEGFFVDLRLVLIGDEERLCPTCSPTDENVLTVDAAVGSGNALEAVLRHYVDYRHFLRPGARKHIVVVTEDDDELEPDSFIAQLGLLTGPGFSDGFVFHAIVNTDTETDTCAVRGERYLELASSTGGFTAPLNCGCGEVCNIPDPDATFDALAQAIGDGVVDCAISGEYRSEPVINYSCALATRRIHVENWGFLGLNGRLFVGSDDGAGGIGLPTALLGVGSACANGRFEVTSILGGTCAEHYRLIGHFTDEDTWSGTLSLEFVPEPEIPAACFDCTHQLFEVTGRR